MPSKPKKERQGLNLDQFFQPAVGGDDLDFLLGAPEETAVRAQSQGLPLLDLPIETIAPDPDQVRRIPRPDDLLQMEATGDRATLALLAELRALGESLREHGQVQPAIVYPDTDTGNPAVTHRLLHGQRRWTAASLAGIPTLWVVEVERPTEVSRLLRQVEENERRAGLVDMERAWALVSLREALQRELGKEVPWSVVEARLQISEGRRHDLLRLLRFSPEAQELILRYGWAEWTLRPLHQSIGAGSLDMPTATDMLRVLAEQPEVTAPAVKALVDMYLQERQAKVNERGEPEVVAQSRGDGFARSQNAESLDRITRRIIGLRQNVEQLKSQVSRSHRSEQRQSWQVEVKQLQTSLEELLALIDEE